MTAKAVCVRWRQPEGTICTCLPYRLGFVEGLCREAIESDLERSKHAFSILRIFTDFRIPRLPM